MKQQVEREVLVKMRMMLSNLLMRFSTATIQKNSILSMLGKSCVMIRNGVSFPLQKPKDALNGGSVMMALNHEPHTHLKRPMVKKIKAPVVRRV